MSKNASRPLASKVAKTAPSVKDAEWGGFIDIRMNQEAKEAFQSWMTENSSNLWILFAEVLSKKMKFSLSFDVENDCFISTLTAVIVTSSAWRYALTARAATWEESIYLLLFKHFYMLSEDWTSYRPSQPYNNSWG